MKNYSCKEIERLQKNLPKIREIMGWTATQLAEKLDVTKQTISSLEHNKSVMTKIEYIAIRAIIDDAIAQIKDEKLKKEKELYIKYFLDIEDLSEEEKSKAYSYFKCCRETGLDDEQTCSGLKSALGKDKAELVAQILIGGIIPLAGGIWIQKILKDKK